MRGSVAGGVRFSARCPCWVCAPLVSHTKLHVGFKASISPQEDTKAQCEELAGSHTAKRQIQESSGGVSDSKGPSKVPHHLYHPEGRELGEEDEGAEQGRKELG